MILQETCSLLRILYVSCAVQKGDGGIHYPGPGWGGGGYPCSSTWLRFPTLLHHPRRWPVTRGWGLVWSFKNSATLLIRLMVLFQNLSVCRSLSFHGTTNLLFFRSYFCASISGNPQFYTVFNRNTCFSLSFFGDSLGLYFLFCSWKYLATTVQFPFGHVPGHKTIYGNTLIWRMLW